MTWKDQLPGGLGDEKSPSDFDEDQIRKGVKVEMEHTDDPKTALEIAIDHLTEDPKYYDKLEKIEPHHASAQDESKNPGFQSFPYPHDLKDFEPVEKEPSIYKAPRKSGTFVEGDEFVVQMSTVATELYERGQHDLASQMSQFVNNLIGG